MKVSAFRDLSSGELAERIEEMREQMLKLRFQKSTGQIENPQTITMLRRDLARALTVQRERQIRETGSDNGGGEPGGGAAEPGVEPATEEDR